MKRNGVGRVITWIRDRAREGRDRQGLQGGDKPVVEISGGVGEQGRGRDIGLG